LIQREVKVINKFEFKTNPTRLPSDPPQDDQAHGISIKAKHLKWLYDIKIAIIEIERFIEDHGKTFEVYKTNLLLKRQSSAISKSLAKR